MNPFDVLSVETCATALQEKADEVPPKDINAFARFQHLCAPNCGELTPNQPAIINGNPQSQSLPAGTVVMLASGAEVMLMHATLVEERLVNVVNPDLKMPSVNGDDKGGRRYANREPRPECVPEI